MYSRGETHFQFHVYVIVVPVFRVSTVFKYHFSQFQITKLIGTGHFAQVYLAQNTINQAWYAIKAINKKKLATKQQIKHVHDEKDVLLSASHPFLVKLWGTFQTDSHVFFVTDYVPGGELFRLIRKKKVNKKQKPNIRCYQH